MAYQVIYKKRFSNKLVKLLKYLEKDWDQKVASDFLIKLERRIDTIRKYPLIGKPSSKNPEIRAILISKHNRLYYKFSNSRITIMNMYDTRANPKNSPY